MAAAPPLAQARRLSAALPELLVEAQRAVASVTAGWHGRRQAGPGETFWQYRAFSPGEAAARIDWRRSARDSGLYVREREWENAETVWLWADLSPSMVWRSASRLPTKQERAAVLTLALADLLARAGERVGVPGLLRPTPDRRAAERIAARWAACPAQAALPALESIGRFSEVVILSDGLDDPADWTATANRVAAAGARLHVVQVLDPAEEAFPFAGRTEFRDPETGERILAGRAEHWAADYRRLLTQTRDALSRLAARTGGRLLVHHTDRPASEALIALHGLLAAGYAYQGRREAAS